MYELYIYQEILIMEELLLAKLPLLQTYKKDTSQSWCLFLFNQQLPILPGRRHPSTFGVYELNYCVRDGNRWTLVAIVTEFVRVCTLKTA